MRTSDEAGAHQRAPHVSSSDELGQVVTGRVSLIVPTRNAETTIRSCLMSIRAQSHPDVELVVVDNGSTDATLAIARDLADRVLTHGPERSAQRNLGAAISTGEFLVFIDADMRVSPRVAQAVVEAFRADLRLQALVIPERAVGEGFWARCRALEKEIYLGDPDIEAARAFRRSAFEGVGGYDERMHGPEDWDLPERIAATGQAIGRVASPVLHDEGRLTLRRDLTKKLYYGRSLGRYVRKHPRLATRKLVRLAFIRKLPLLVRDPVHAAGLVLLKTLELVAAGTGLARSVVAQPQPRLGTKDMLFSLHAEFRNWYLVGPLVGIVVPNRIFPRSGIPALSDVPFTVRLRNGWRVGCRMSELLPFIEVFVRRDYEIAGFDWQSAHTILDVGSNVGAATLWFASKAPSARIVAIEPDPKSAELLRQNVQRNGLGDRVRVLEIAMGDEAGMGRLETDARSTVHTRVRVPAREVKTTDQGVEIATLAEILRRTGIESLDLLKLDCEGCEFAALAAAEERTLRRIQAIVGEFHRFSEGSLEELVAALRKAGFECEFESGPELGRFWAIRSPSSDR